MDLDADTGALWHAATALLDAGTLQQHLLDDQEQRRQAVAHVQGCQALEGVVRRSPAQQARLQRYVDGASIETLLAELRAEQRQGQAEYQ